MKFEEALNNLIGIEGKYVNDPDDKGGETFMGIARNYHPDWLGWRYIDNYKELYPPDFTSKIENDSEIESLAVDFYKKEYWNKFKGDDLPYIIAEELLEQSVNLGTWKTAGINLQKALNLLNRNGRLFDDLKVDGLVGKKTLEAVRRVSQRRLLRVLNGLQFMHYYNSDIKNPKNEKYVGWFDRV